MLLVHACAAKHRKGVLLDERVHQGHVVGYDVKGVAEVSNGRQRAQQLLAHVDQTHLMHTRRRSCHSSLYIHTYIHTYITSTSTPRLRHAGKTHDTRQAHHLAQKAACVAEEVTHVRVPLDLVELLGVVVHRRQYSRRARAF